MRMVDRLEDLYVISHLCCDLGRSWAGPFFASGEIGLPHGSFMAGYFGAVAASLPLLTAKNALLTAFFTVSQ